MTEQIKFFLLKLSFSLIVIMFLIQTANPQATDITFGKTKHFYLGLTSSPLKNSINLENALILEDLICSSQNSIFWSLDAGYFFSENIGLSTGIGYRSLVCNLSLAEFSQNYDTLDFEMDNYRRYISGTTISETQKLSYLSVPVVLNLQLPVGNKIGIYLQPGINLLFNLESSYRSLGKFTYEGYYSKFNVTMKDLPFEGFESNYLNNETGNLLIKSFTTEFMITSGAYLKIKDNIHIKAGITYSKLLSDISDYEPSATFRLSANPDNLNSLMAGSDNVTIKSIGINFGIRYFLK